MAPRYKLFAAALVAGLVCASCAIANAAMTLQEKCRLGAWLALHVAKEAPPLAVPSPDSPDQGDTCEECGGTGKLGDGTVFVKCGACNGTGRKPASAFDSAASVEALQIAELRQEAAEYDAKLKAAAAAPKPTVQQWATPPKDGRTYRKVCRGGKCHWELVP